MHDEVRRQVLLNGATFRIRLRQDDYGAQLDGGHQQRHVDRLNIGKVNRRGNGSRVEHDIVRGLLKGDRGIQEV